MNIGILLHKTASVPFILILAVVTGKKLTAWVLSSSSGEARYYFVGTLTNSGAGMARDGRRQKDRQIFLDKYCFR